MKVLESKYPKGSFKGQKSDGRYVDDFLYANLENLADNIIKDMTFMGVISSSTLEVGTGKSVLATQIGEIWSDIIKQKHNIDLGWAVKNIVWKPEDLIERSFDKELIPKYSLILLDEWEDSHYWSKLGMTLRQFFRKCRQLNLFILIIIPNFFQLPMNYAIGRSIFFIDVKFTDNFERGNYDFYDFKKKKNLYMNGRKFHNYNVTQPSFKGWFADGYGVNEEEYRKKKKEDLEDWEEDDKKGKSAKEIKHDAYYTIYNYAKKKGIDLTHEFFAEAEGCTRQNITQVFKKRAEQEQKLKKSNKLLGESRETSNLKSTYYNSPEDNPDAALVPIEETS